MRKRTGHKNIGNGEGEVIEVLQRGGTNGVFSCFRFPWPDAERRSPFRYGRLRYSGRRQVPRSDAHVKTTSNPNQSTPNKTDQRSTHSRRHTKKDASNKANLPTGPVSQVALDRCPLLVTLDPSSPEL